MVKLLSAFMQNYNRRKNVLLSHGLFSYLFNSSGYVIIIVVIITWSLVSVAGEFLSVSQTNIGYMRKMQNRIKAGYIATSGFKLAEFILMADDRGITAEMITGKTTDKTIDSYNDIWAVQFPPMTIDEEDGTLQLTISDENSKINLSILSNEVFKEEHTPYYAILQRFLLNMGLSMDLADIMVDWVDVDDSRSAYGAESPDYYQTLTPPYTAQNSEMDSIDELLMLKDITPEIYYGLGGGNYGLEQNLVKDNKGDVSIDMDKILELTGGTKPESGAAPAEEHQIGKEESRKLSDYLRAYGDRNEYNNELNKININTAPFRVLSALTDNMTDDIVTDIINRRLIQPFKSVDEIKDVITDETIRRNMLTVKSYIFKITSTATYDNTEVTVTAYYNRLKKKIVYWSEN